MKVVSYCFYVLQDTFNITLNFINSEPNKLHIIKLNNLLPDAVLVLRIITCMNGPIYLDYQSFFMAIEICYAKTEGMPAAKHPPPSACPGLPVGPPRARAGFRPANCFLLKAPHSAFSDLVERLRSFRPISVIIFER